MAENDGINVGLTLLSATQGFVVFNQFLPKISEVRQASPETNKTLEHDVRMGEIAGTALTLGVGGIISSLTKSNAPVLVAGLVALGYIALYEITLRGIKPVEIPSNEPTIEDVTTTHTGRNESGSLRTGFPFGDEITYDVDRTPPSSIPGGS